MSDTCTPAVVIPEDDLVTQQMGLEIVMRDLGIEAFRKKVQKAQEGGREEATSYGNALMDAAIPKMQAAIEAHIAERETGRAGQKGAAYKYLRLIGDNALCAYIACRGILGFISKPRNMTATAIMLADMLQDEVTFRAVREEDDKLYQRLANVTRTRVTYEQKATVAKLLLRREEYDPLAWPKKDKVILGAFLIETLIEATGLIEKQKIYHGVNDYIPTIVPSKSTLDYISRRNGAAELLSPQYAPMVTPPNDWTTPWNGGYLTRSVRPLRLVKTSHKPTLKAIEAADMERVYDAVNVAQRVSWKVNPFILSVLEAFWDLDYSVPGIPTRFALEIPPKPHDIAENEEARREWRKAAAAIYRENINTVSARTRYATTMTTARRYSAFPAIYFPQQLDFRGRLYSVPQFNPQGPDYMKGLLHFAVGKPLDEESAPYLAIHLANCGDFKTPEGKTSKLPLEDRVQWVYDNQEAILACARDPFANRWWTEADLPVCFLAACHEWAGWVEQGVGFVSYLAVALDGSCSGLQHFSAMFRDEIGGATTNLVPSDRPSDIYTVVMDGSRVVLEGAATGTDEEAEFARQWLSSGLMARSTFKRPTMTFPYGSKATGFANQLRTDTLHPAFKDHVKALRDGLASHWPFEGDGYRAALYLAQVIYKVVSSAVKKAAEAMDWLAKMARVVASAERTVQWTTPDGLPVTQRYFKMKGHRIDTMIAGNRLTFTLNEELDEVDRHKQASTLPPNFVHSLDATHLRVTVRAARDEGMRHFALVHDSFGVHAADTARFFSLLRETMWALYEETDVPTELYHQLLAQLDGVETSKPLPLPPERGNLDLSSILESDFAFA